MREIHVSHQFAAPIEAVYAAISDHEKFLSGTDLACSVVRPGRDERNGAGALREVRSGHMLMSEEITVFERPRRLEYLIRKATFGGRELPLKHERGWIELRPEGGGTRVDWRSRIAIHVPLVGGLLERQFERKVGAAFEKLLQRAEKGLARSA